MHKQNIYNGDIKPSNLLLFLTPEGVKIKVGDLGTSIYMNKNKEAGLYKVKAATLKYCSPEIQRKF